MNMKKPPVGLEPRYIYESIRITQITDAIRRYLDADLEIPAEWIEEYNDLQSRQIHVIPIETYRCDICGQEHRVGETCPYEPTGMMSAAGVEFDDPIPKPGRCYVCGYIHPLGKGCPDGP